MSLHDAGAAADHEAAERLKKHGLEETEPSVANKISRGHVSSYVFSGEPQGDRVRTGRARGHLKNSVVSENGLKRGTVGRTGPKTTGDAAHLEIIGLQY